MPESPLSTERLQAQGAAASRPPSPAPSTKRTRIWDLPTRIFHWALAAAVLAMIATGLAGSMDWHFRVGYAVLALLLFRLVWGFVGGRWSRFASFLATPASIAAYLKGRQPPELFVGHSPIGALSVFAMLAVFVAQVATGLMSDDEVSASGPLTRFVSNAWVSQATGWHTGFGQWLVIGLVVLHLLAVLVYVAVKKRVLIGPMLHGDRTRLPETVVPSRDDARSRLVALVIFAACAAASAYVASLRA